MLVHKWQVLKGVWQNVEIKWIAVKLLSGLVILEAADAHLGRDESLNVLFVLPVSESHRVRLMVSEVLMELKPRELEVKGDEITLPKRLSDQGQ